MSAPVGETCEVGCPPPTTLHLLRSVIALVVVAAVGRRDRNHIRQLGRQRGSFVRSVEVPEGEGRNRLGGIGAVCSAPARDGVVVPMSLSESIFVPMPDRDECLWEARGLMDRPGDGCIREEVDEACWSLRK
jgi:hypothetical protein